MKMHQPYSVPLSRQSLAILSDMRSLSGSGRYAFPSVRTRQRPISDNTISAALRRMGFPKDQMTAHGFRTSASSLLNESGKWNPDAIERALAHMVAGSARRIYNQSAYWPERVDMAQRWSDYPTTNSGGHFHRPFGPSRSTRRHQVYTVYIVQRKRRKIGDHLCRPGRELPPASLHERGRALDCATGKNRKVHASDHAQAYFGRAAVGKWIVRLAGALAWLLEATDRMVCNSPGVSESIPRTSDPEIPIFHRAATRL
jgi:hypothetical protein